jgi:hypothetical protein
VGKKEATPEGGGSSGGSSPPPYGLGVARKLPVWPMSGLRATPRGGWGGPQATSTTFVVAHSHPATSGVAPLLLGWLQTLLLLFFFYKKNNN